MVDILIALLVFVAVYVIAKFLLAKVASLAPIAEVIAILLAVFVTIGFHSGF